MERLVASDGGRILKASVIAFGTMFWAAPLFAQAAPDPLAPLPVKPAASQFTSPAVTTPVTAPATAPATQPAVTQPAVTQPAVTQPAVTQPATTQSPTPTVSAVFVPTSWRGVFDAIDTGNWASAQAGITALPRSVLTPVAKAELYTAKGSPFVDVGSLQALIAEAPELPQADQLALMAYKRGVTTPSLTIPEKPTYSIGSAPIRYKAKPVAGEPYADQLRALLDPLIKTNDAAGAEAQLLAYAPSLSVEARAEAAQRVAFVYYVLGLDMDARRVSDTWRQGATGEWASQAAWISGLASWRLGDCESASRSFQQ